MKVKLRQLKPNRTRDMTVDPIDQQRVHDLALSIKDEGFWGGVVVAPDGNGGYEILAGHHRVYAAIEAGMVEAEVFVLIDADDAKRLHVYAVENATQRGSEGTAQSGTVAGAIRVLSACLTKGVRPTLWDAPEDRASWEHGLVSFRSGDGVGQRLIEKLLKDVPGINRRVVEAQLANLKTSGHYDRIVAEAIAAVRAATPDLPPDVEERITRVEAVAATRTPTFDLVGVSQVLTTPDHVSSFRQLVTGEGMKGILPVDQQATLARTIVEKAKEDGAEVTRTFIREHATGLMLQSKQAAQHFDREQAERARNADMDRRLRDTMGQLNGRIGQATAAVVSLEEQLRAWPKRRPVPLDRAELRDTCQRTIRALETLLKTLGA